MKKGKKIKTIWYIWREYQYVKAATPPPLGPGSTANSPGRDEVPPPLSSPTASNAVSTQYSHGKWSEVKEYAPFEATNFFVGYNMYLSHNPNKPHKEINGKWKEESISRAKKEELLT